MATNVHRLKTTGEGASRAYTCSCGGWSVSGSRSRDRGIRQAHSQHVSQAPRETAKAAEPEGEPQE